ncbi:hypothetical protein WA026_003571 [Henosepilachna vigintioctopunctata]|uniref:Uncharacterized protein n=1 Tax=Henosepilachna vigintioctopunctata TaxID=420089 RepID=A0AAW1TJ91_9CUCU
MLHSTSKNTLKSHKHNIEYETPKRYPTSSFRPPPPSQETDTVLPAIYSPTGTFASSSGPGLVGGGRRGWQAIVYADRASSPTSDDVGPLPRITRRSALTHEPSLTTPSNGSLSTATAATPRHFTPDARRFLAHDEDNDMPSWKIGLSMSLILFSTNSPRFLGLKNQCPIPTHSIQDLEHNNPMSS